jgi:2-dehydro-3-deoxy-D-arabinonate dehydratase
MLLIRHQTEKGPRWAADGHWLAEPFDFCHLLGLRKAEMGAYLAQSLSPAASSGQALAPIEDLQDVWASGVTYLRSREARRAESDMGDVYDRVYVAQRPELFFKSNGWRVMGPEQPVRIRADSRWNVPEPELTLVINAHGEIVGYTAGNDMSSRSIEGENPLYLPQAKIYDGSCALGPAIRLADGESFHGLQIQLSIERAGQQVFEGRTSTANMNRKLEELVVALFRELSFPQGAFLLTGTGIVPPESFTLAPGDCVTISVGELTLVNPVSA